MRQDIEKYLGTAVKTCSIGNCNSIVKARGWCAAHYKLWRTNGDPLMKKKRANGDGGFARGYLVSQVDGVWKYDHVDIAERALGKQLPPEAIVHHWNEIKHDNRNENLLICPDRAYHNLIHARMDALKACGNANWLRCKYCKSYDAPENLSQARSSGRSSWHKACVASYNLRRWRIRNCRSLPIINGEAS